MNQDSNPTTELALAQAQTAHTTRCAPFCDSKELHAVDPTAADGNCRSREFSTALNVTPWVAGYPVIADVGAFRDGITGASVVELTLRSTGHYDGAEVRLTADEARRIARHLLAVADLTEER